MKKKQYKAVFRARIDFKNDEPQQGLIREAAKELFPYLF